MPAPLSNDPKPPIHPSQTGGPAPAPASAEAPEIKDNLTVGQSIVVDSNSGKQPLFEEIPDEAPALASPEDFKKKKKSVSQEAVNYFELLLAQSKINLDSKQESLKARQRSLGKMQEAQKESAKEMDKKIDEQAEKQTKSAAKSGFLSIFSKIFTAVTAVIGAVMLFVPGLQVAGALMLAGAAVSIATQIPGVMEGLGKMFTALLTPLLGKELAEKIGPIFATVLVAVVQIALSVASAVAVTKFIKLVDVAKKSMDVLDVKQKSLDMLRLAATALKWAASSAGTVQGGVSGGVGIALGANNISLADITRAVDSLSALNDSLNTQVEQMIQTINQNYQQMTNDLRRMSQQVDSIPTFQVA